METPQEGLIKVKINNEEIEVDQLWDTFSESIGYGGMDIASYVTGGMSIWPCGRSFQEGGRDGFDEDSGPSRCVCETCERVRSLLSE